MMKSAIQGVILILFTQLILLRCDAPRNNPLDPQNPNNAFVVLEGVVQTFSVPRHSIAGVNVLWKNNGTTVVTDKNGYFQFEEISPKNGWLGFEREGFHDDSVFITWDQLDKVSIQALLNAKPQIGELLVFSVVKTRSPSIRDFEVTLKAEITDPDVDIDSVFWQVPDLAIDSSLRFNPDLNLYDLTFATADYGLSLGEIVGHDFIIFVKDKFDRQIEIGRDQIERVILEDISVLSPANGSIVSSTPMFEWKKFNPGFSHSFIVDIRILNNDGFPEAFLDIEDIPEGSQNYSLTTPLIVGDYVWALWAVDSFGNRIRSSFATFSVIQQFN
jgi:hypothetical protein